MSRRDQVPYYDDDGLMEIVDYSTPRRGEDLTNPNAPRQVNTTQPRDTVIVPATPAHRTTRVIDDEFFITERFDRLELNSGEVLDVLDLSGEAGEIISIEVVTDNPYTGVYLEMDDYKNSRGASGVTAAELIMRNKTEPTEREFYATDMTEDGKFVIRYSPIKGDPYTDKIRLQVRNDITGTNTIYSRVPNNRQTMRQGLPTPRLLSHSAGWYVKHQDFEGVRATEVAKMLRRLGPYRYQSPIRNLAPLDDPSVRVGPYSPHMNTAAEIKFAQCAITLANARLVWGEPGQPVTGTTGLVAPNTAQWPGELVGDTHTPSEQQFIVYPSRAEDETEANAAFDANSVARVNNPLYIKNGDTIYFPGLVTKVQFYDDGNSRFQDQDAESDIHQAGTDGAVVVTVSPGLPFKPKKLTLDAADATGKNAFGDIFFEGNLTPKTASSRIRVEEVVVRRKRKKTLLL